MHGIPVPPYLEAIALVEHFLSLFGDIFTLYFNSNREILFLCFMNMGQHILKIVRILFLGFALDNFEVFNPTSCYIHAFINQFTMFTSLAAACLLIFTLYGVIVHPNFYSKYYVRYRPYTYGFIMVYTALHVLIGLFEQIFIGYEPMVRANLQNCGCGLRTKLYQYVFGSAVFTLPFTIPAVYCSCIIIYKIIVVPRNSIKKQITSSTKMSFTRWVKILCYSVLITLLSFANLIQDVLNGIKAEHDPNGLSNEDDSLGYVYFFTASSGILIFLFTNSRNQIKKKLGYSVKNDESNFNSNYNASSNSSLYKKSNMSLVSGPNGKYNINSSRIYATNPQYFNNSSTSIGIDNVIMPYDQGSPNIYDNAQQYFENGSNVAYGGSNAAYGGSNAAYGGGSNPFYGDGSNTAYGGGSNAAYGSGSPLPYTSKNPYQNAYL